jgi:hypothetical protein
MNEKIKKFMKEAGTDSSGKWMGVEHAEKFAELIVKECIRIDIENPDAAPGLEIANYFGVER